MLVFRSLGENVVVSVTVEPLNEIGVLSEMTEVTVFKDNILDNIAVLVVYLTAHVAAGVGEQRAFCLELAP